ncbi:hypothetical protein AGLY_001474 [Aphis glycines]|uniref:Uncharacterized protein n=1 Tax=Aphis glycines TaxID=307491 RepID=A0A6G0U5A3_APHGL|nr:hypothetical protein AGLY_001474 [Aphis glycines]
MKRMAILIIMTIRGVSSHEETIVFYEVHNSHVELQHTTWGTTERITLALNDENNTRVHMNLGCIFSIKPATIVLNSTLTRITIEKMCEMTLKTVGLDNEKYILFPRNVRHLRVILSKSLHQTNITIPTTIKPIMTNSHDYNLTTLDNVEHSINKNNTNYETISQIIKANLTVEEPTDVANKFDYGDITLDTTERIEDRTNITNTNVVSFKFYTIEQKNRQIEVIYLTTEGHRRLVPLVENARLDVVPEFGLEIKETAGGRLVTLRLNRGDEMLGEMLLYQYLGCMEFERNTMYLHICCAHSEICWDWHEPHGTLTEESVLCKCILDEFRREGNRRIHLTPIPYERPHMWLPTMNLLGSVSFFTGRDGSTRWGLKIRFLINLGRKIKHQRHTFIVGDREIPACFDHHVHSAAAIMPYPMRPHVVEQTIATLRSDLLRIIQSDEPYTSSMCWIMKREILRTTSRGYF